jgi:hypothetical protein
MLQVTVKRDPLQCQKRPTTVSKSEDVGKKNSAGKGVNGDATMLSARERLRLQVNRNLVVQQQAAADVTRDVSHGTRERPVP